MPCWLSIISYPMRAHGIIVKLLLYSTLKIFCSVVCNVTGVVGRND